MHKEIYTSQEAYDILLEEQKSRPVVFLKSGMYALDRCIQGFRGGELTVLSGKTGHGKTLFAISLTKKFANAGQNSLWFSYEVGTFDFLEKTKDKDDNLPFFYLPLHLIPNRLDYIEFKVKEAKKVSHLHAVFIDHLHYLCDLKDIKLNIEISRVMRWLKVLAVKYNIAIFIIAHVQKMTDLKVAEIDNDHLRDSSSVAQEADNVFFVIRSPKEDNLAKLKITKNRWQGHRNKIIELVKIGNYFEEVFNERS